MKAAPPKGKVPQKGTHARRGQGREGGGVEAEVGVAAGVQMGFESVKHEEGRQEECWPERKKTSGHKRENDSNEPPPLDGAPSSFSPSTKPSSLLAQISCIVRGRLYS